MEIRRATIQDKNKIVTLMDEFNNYYYDNNIFSEEFLPFWEYKDKQAIFDETAQEWLTKSEYMLFVAEENGEIIGYICGQVKERKPRVLDKEGYINDWFVKEGKRKKGVGMKLYKTLIEQFKEQKCNRLGLLTNTRNKETIDFYHKLGFIDESLTMVKQEVE
jgi:GNAT superfamily N-acetyltransferase